MAADTVSSAHVPMVMHGDESVVNKGVTCTDRSTIIQLFSGFAAISFYGVCVANDTGLWRTGHGAWAAFLMLLTGCLSLRSYNDRAISFKYLVVRGWLFTLSICSSLSLVVLAGLDLCVSWHLGTMVVFACSMLMTSGVLHACATVVRLVRMYKGTNTHEYEKAMWGPPPQKGC